MTKRLLIQSFLLAGFFLAGCRNMYEETAKKDTPNAIFYQAKMDMNNRDYSSAIALLQTLDPVYLAQPPVALVYASAFSGRCGLEFVNFLTDLEGITSANSMFAFLMKEYPGATDAKISDCIFSEGILNSLGDQTQRSADENILMGLSSLTKIGTVLSRYADTNADGTLDPTFDHCDTTAFPDTAVRQIGSGMALAIMSISAVASDITSDTLQDITSMCALDPNLNVYCTNSDPNAFSQNEVDALRALIGSSQQGVGDCTGGFLTCICP